MHKIGNLTLKECWYILLAVLIPFVCVGGSTYFPYHLRVPVLVVVSIVSFIISLSVTKKITLNLISFLWLTVSFFICVSALNSYDRESTLEYGIILIMCSLMLFVDFPRNMWERVLTVINAFVIVIAVSIIASVFFENLMVDQFWFIVNPTRMPELDEEILTELSYGSYSGFAGEKAEAAFIMNVGLALLFSKYFSKTKCTVWDLIELCIIIIALILTGKRTLFLVPIMLFVVMMLMSNIKQKFLKFILIAIFAACVVIIMSAFIPQMSVMYDRLIGNTDSEYYTLLSGRDDLWVYSFMMFAENPIIGTGYASYNVFAYNHGYLYNGEMWKYYGHSCYFELLGEVGIVGFILIYGLFIAAFVLTIKYMRNSKTGTADRRLLMFSFYIQAMFFIYSVTGNVMYQTDQLFLWFCAMAVTMNFHRKYCRENGKTLRNLRGVVNV